MSEHGFAASPEGVGGRDLIVVERITALADITGAVAGSTDVTRVPDRRFGALPDVLGEVAAAATRRLRNRGLTFVPRLALTGDDNVPVVHVDDGDPVPVARPDVCVVVAHPVGSSYTGVVGHLHLSCVDGVQPDAADAALVGFLAGFAVDLAAAREREHLLRGALSTAGTELAAAQNDAHHLTEALASSRTIGIAIGILTALHKVTSEEAFDRLRLASQNSNRKLRDVAADVVFTGETPPVSRSTARPRWPAPPAGTGGARPSAQAPEPDGISEPDRDHSPRRGCQLDLVVRRDRTELRLAGELDLAAHADLTGLLQQLDHLAVPVHCLAAHVTFADSHGVAALIDAARRRNRNGTGRLVIGPASPAMSTAVRRSGAAHLLDPTEPP